MSVSASGVGVRREEGKAFIPKGSKGILQELGVAERSRILGRSESEVGGLKETIF